MSVFATTLLKPFVVLIIMIGIVLPMSLLVRSVLPDGAAKRVLFDRSLFKRHKGLAWLAVIASYTVLVLLFFALGGHKLI